MVSGNFFSGLGVKLIRDAALPRKTSQAMRPWPWISYNFWSS